MHFASLFCQDTERFLPHLKLKLSYGAVLNDAKDLIRSCQQWEFNMLEEQEMEQRIFWRRWLYLLLRTRVEAEFYLIVLERLYFLKKALFNNAK